VVRSRDDEEVGEAHEVKSPKNHLLREGIFGGISRIVEIAKQPKSTIH